MVYRLVTVSHIFEIVLLPLPAISPKAAHASSTSSLVSPPGHLPGPVHLRVAFLIHFDGSMVETSDFLTQVDNLSQACSHRQPVPLAIPCGGKEIGEDRVDMVPCVAVNLFIFLSIFFLFPIRKNISDPEDGSKAFIQICPYN